MMKLDLTIQSPRCYKALGQYNVAIVLVLNSQDFVLKLLFMFNNKFGKTSLSLDSIIMVVYSHIFYLIMSYDVIFCWELREL
jgi:hypothetical protein